MITISTILTLPSMLYIAIGGHKNVLQLKVDKLRSLIHITYLTSLQINDKFVYLPEIQHYQKVANTLLNLISLTITNNQNLKSMNCIINIILRYLILTIKNN